VVLFEDLPKASDAMRVAERIQQAFEAPFLLQGQEAYTTCSMGLALSASSATVPSELVRDSEVAMYRAKAKREGSIEIFDPSMNAQALARFQMESELRRGLERGEFLLHYQPLVSLRTGCIEGWEALVRWKHPERGMVSPLDFISLAEETGLIVPLGKWVLEEAVRQASLWAARFPSDPPRLISVNISGRQFQQRDLISMVMSALDQNSFDPRCLKLEITESVMMRDPQASLEAMNVFRSHEIHLVIDDFGTGYSSLSYLKRFPVDTLKVDKSFVDGLGKDSESTAIVQAVISLAKSLGMRVTAEGIETKEQLEHLRSLDCDQGQGYFLARPLSAVAAEELLMKNPRW
jgi:EAL domain-containing protein (putative c-di-GMP-specific phosphodiesterase class I)